MAARSTATSSLNEALLKNRAVQVITMGNKALICCKYEDLKTVSFRQHSSRYCAIPSCKNFRGKFPSMSFFQFPKDVERCKKWVDFCRRDDLKSKDLTMLFRSGHSICAEHFEDSMFMNPKVKNRLIHCAVPTLFDPSCPPPPLSIKDLSTRIMANMENSPVVSTEEADLCVFHRKFLKSITVLDTEVNSVHFCMRCGSAVAEIEEVSQYVYRVICKRRHEMLLSVELASKCREWVVDCRGIDRMKEVTNPHNRCHLCEDHFVSLQPQQDFEECAPVPEHGGELGTSAPLLDEIKDSGSVTTIIQVSNVGDLKPIEVNLLPLETQTTVAKDEAIRQPVLSSESHWPQPNLSAHPCLPSSFFSIRGFTSHLAKVLGRDIPAPSSVGCKFVQTDGTLKSQREFILYKKVASCRVQICRLKKRIETLEAGAKKPVQISIQLLSKELSKYLSGACLRLVQEQLKVNKANNRGIRWSEDLITLAKIIRNESFKAYSILKRIISLPTRTTIKRHPVPPEGLPNLTEFLKTAFTSDISPGTKENVKHDDCDVEHDEKDNYMMEEPCVSEEIDVPGDDVLKAVEDEVALEEQRTMAAAQSLQDTNSCIQLTPVLGASDALHIYEVFAQTAATLHGDGEIHLQVPTTDAVVVNNAQ